MEERYKLHLGDCFEVLKTLPDGSVDAVITDPPYGLSFMGKRWDASVPSVEVWQECLRVAKPGAHLLSFAGTRTQHRMAVAIEDAGWFIRDMIAWVYGCLDEQTEVATKDGVKPYHKTKAGDLVLCYDASEGSYSYEPILEVVEYDYEDTAYRLVGDFGEQVVSRNHRCIVERGGKEVFVCAEDAAREQQARVPVLESLPELRQALSDAEQGTGAKEKDVQQSLCERTYRQSQFSKKAFESAQREGSYVRGVRASDMEAGRMVTAHKESNLQQGVQRQTSGEGVGAARAQRPCEMETGVRKGASRADDRRHQPCLEGRGDIPQPEGGVCESVNQVCAMPSALAQHGTQGRLCDGASTGGCACNGQAADALGVRSSHQSRCDGQSAIKLDAFQDQRRAQVVRAWRGHKTAVVRVVPFHYTGKVWCLRVPTGAFVAVRNGVAFPTGNSGFPKSLDVSKAIDKAAGAEREVVGKKITGNAKQRTSRTGEFADGNHGGQQIVDITAPATEAAKQWQGWGTALKPSLEPITLARKPMIGTVAANVLEHGTGALNIDGCRVGVEAADLEQMQGRSGASTANKVWGAGIGNPTGWEPSSAGRWPANLIHDGSDEATAGMGSAARFFYCAKASKQDRDEGCETLDARTAGCMNMRNDAHAHRTGNTFSPKRNPHPTVKPTDLMRYLCRLVTPPNGIVLDPFMGSGSTGKAAMLEGLRFIGIELEPEYMEIAKRRIEAEARQRTLDFGGEA